jgi:hypothetical protein
MRYFILIPAIVVASLAATPAGNWVPGRLEGNQLEGSFAIVGVPASFPGAACAPGPSEPTAT